MEAVRQVKKSVVPTLTKDNIDAMIKDSITESLIGAIPYSNKSLKDHRSEKLQKYE